MAEFERFERAGWAKQSASYDEGFALLCAGAHPAMLDTVPLDTVPPGARLLEVGCGTGKLTAEAAARGLAVVATDPVPDMVARARRAVPGVRSVAAALPGLPFTAGVFDAALGAFVINHVGDPVAALADLRRVLRDGGRLTLSSWDRHARNRALGVVSDAVAEVGATLNGPGEHAPMRHYADLDSFGELLTEAGFRAVEVRRESWTHRVHAEDWWHAVRTGTVRTAALLDDQSPRTMAQLRAAYLRIARRYQGQDGLRLPASALVATGVK